MKLYIYLIAAVLLLNSVLADPVVNPPGYTTQLAFNDSFNDNDISDWTTIYTSQTWGVSGGIINCNGAFWCQMGQANLTAFTEDWMIQMEVNVNHLVYGAVARDHATPGGGSSINSFYAGYGPYLPFNNDPDQYLIQERTTPSRGATTTVLSQNGYEGVWWNVTLTYIDGNLTIYRDGIALGSASNSTFATLQDTVILGAYGNSLNNRVNFIEIYNLLAGNTTVTATNPTQGELLDANSVDFNYSITIEATPTTRNCSLYINGTLNQTTNGLTNGTYGFNSFLDNGAWSYYVVCNASGVPNAASNTINFTVDADINLFNISIYDEQTNELIDNATFTIQLISDDETNFSQFNTSNGTLITNFRIPGDYEIRYFGANNTDYTNPRSRFTILNAFSIKNVRLYALKDSVSDFFLPVVRDQTESTVEGATVTMIRGYGEAGSLVGKTVEQAITNPNGIAVLQVEPNDAYYKFKVESTEGNLSETAYFKVTTSTLTFVVQEGQSYLSGLEIYRGASVNLEYLESTDTFRFTWSDATNSIAQGCLLVTKLDRKREESTVLDNCSQTSTGSIVYTITDSNQTSYQARGRIDTGTEFSVWDDWVGVSFRADYADWGLMGVLATFLLVVFLMSVSNSSETVLITGTLGLAVMGLIGIMAFEWTAFVGIPIIAGVGLYLMRR